MNTKLRSLLAAIVTFSLALPGIASADHRSDRHGHGDRHGHSYSQGYKHHHRDRHADYRGHPGRYITNTYRHDDDNDLLLGLVVGGILGYAINGAQQGHAYYYNDR